jgi:predicted AAA+ superfamily ATPase
MRDHTKLRAFELADEVAMLVYHVTAGFPKEELRGLKSAMIELSMHSGTIVTWDDDVALDNEIKVVPAWKWLLE